MNKDILFSEAEKAANYSYSPYSKFRVGAALLCADGEIITGANIENRSFGLTNCAERSAIFTALSKGKKEFKALAIHCPDADYPVSPCGACRQVISEFTESDFPIFFSGNDKNYTESTIGELFPYNALDELRDQ
ncbi:cytidine deaminase [Spirochaeta isovalerica]|uniref:Cytidine deaminase n=1 Tax=Spirochaeta isovalerica TaxID=150 RepID=A0A841RD82_9SPIO|nr:cytidine deaminase [Spirochaeta isovalerica]